ncbi:MAG: hypothetical protein JWN25_2604 [Verrucomicrobiales bacterium]|nr:hypothetical protein [Verrucomicrobiales bacterium]
MKFSLGSFAALAIGLACPGFAQNYSIDWYSIGGGGGTSTGSVYSVSGTIGRPAVGRSSGGNYTLESGFWSIVTVLQTAGGPVLTLGRSGQNVVLSWPDDGAGFQLEQTPYVTIPGSWTAPTQARAVTNAGVISVTVPGVEGYQFFRLKK